MNYPSIRIEGSILSADVLDRLDDAVGQRPADFGFDPSVKVKDEIARAWADAQDYWRIYQRKLDTLKLDVPATTETRNLWIVPFLNLLGYQLEYQPKSIELNGKSYALSHRAINRGDLAVQIIGSRELAGLDRKPERAALRMSAHALVQEYLNLSDQLYGIVTNGRLLRLLRDSSRLVKLTYLEFDLDRIFGDGLFADFAILYRLLHATRLPATHEGSAESIIEKYHQDSLDSGARIRDGLSRAVETAIRNFGNGFLAHPANNELRGAIADGQLEATAYYQNLLRLIYRLLFVMVIEERNLIYPLSPNAGKRQIYEHYYSVQRLRRLSEKRYLADRRHSDHWLSLLATFQLFEDGGPGSKLGIAPLAGDLFSREAIGLLHRSALDNETLLGCLRALSLYENGTGQLIRVNYAALNVEEFGSVYEGLLEYEPVFHSGDGQIEFAFTQGSERAATGSHYTPDDLVQPLIKHSLDYLISDKLKEADPAKALLSLRVADISCGSGHILLAAARRIATELAIVRTGEEQPSPSAFRAAVRDVICNCIYGVDLNPLAVELCKVALWLEAHIPGQPLNFLDHHIKCGNAIVGFARREELEKGVPDEAFVTMPGDDKDIAASFRKRNKEDRLIHEKKLGKQDSLVFTPELEKHLAEILKGWRSIAALPERNPAEIEIKKNRYREFSDGSGSLIMSQIAAIPIAQFYIEKTKENQTKLITDDEYRRYLEGHRTPQGQATAMAWALANRKRFFHWFLEFPEIIEQGGFDCILGNPPFLGNRALTGTYGGTFLNWVKYEYAPAGSVDLVTYFFRRVYELLSKQGFQALISTNTISQGGAREGGLEVIINNGGCINYAARSKKWPGRAAVEVSLIAIKKGDWNAECTLDDKSVKRISSYLDDDDSNATPFRLSENEDLSFIGSYVLGLGFVLEEAEANNLLNCREVNKNVIMPYLNGDDLNSKPDQKASRWVINFFDWEEEKCRSQYPECFQIIEDRVKPERTRLDEKGDFVLRKPLPQRWWIYADKRPKLYDKISKLSRVLVVAQVTKPVAFAFVSPKQVLDSKLVVIASDRSFDFALLQSSIHHYWAWKYCTTLESRLSYTPRTIFETFPFPKASLENETMLADIGQSYHDCRSKILGMLQIGLTKCYNLFHNRDLSPSIIDKVSGKLNEAEDGYQGILELRKLHRELDEAVLDAYGWTDLNLGHDFHEVETLPENDRVRYTISLTARKEVLNRLVALNHQRAEEEKSAATEIGGKSAVKKAGKGKKVKVEEPGLFG